MTISASLPIAIVAVLSFGFVPATEAATAVPGGYVVVVSTKTHQDPAWRRVVEALQHKYAGVQVIDYDHTLREVKPRLAKLMPRYTCFVGQPGEVGRDFVVQVHRLTRGLNDDPYELGMLWDRDTVAFYGDPAWDARFPPHKLDWEQQVEQHGRQFELTITPSKDGNIGAVFAFLPERVSHAVLLDGMELKPVIGSFFVMVPNVGKVKQGQAVKVRFQDGKAS